MNTLAGAEVSRPPIVPTIAAMAIAYILGEALGRLACISFGCCYGKPISEVGQPARQLFERFYFAFYGETKKIAYASTVRVHRLAVISETSRSCKCRATEAVVEVIP